MKAERQDWKVPIRKETESIGKSEGQAWREGDRDKQWPADSEARDAINRNEDHKSVRWGWAHKWHIWGLVPLWLSRKSVTRSLQRNHHLLDGHALNMHWKVGRDCGTVSGGSGNYWGQVLRRRRRGRKARLNQSEAPGPWSWCMEGGTRGAEHRHSGWVLGDHAAAKGSQGLSPPHQ